MTSPSFSPREIPRVHLCLLPTPIMFLERLTKYLGGARIFVKRDDLTGVALGGNKGRFSLVDWES